jgi:hypothetical protein
MPRTGFRRNRKTLAYSIVRYSEFQNIPSCPFLAMADADKAIWITSARQPEMASLACPWQPSRHSDRWRNIPHYLGMLQMGKANYRPIHDHDKNRRTPACATL